MVGENMNICEGCEKVFDCEEPCKEAIGWKRPGDECYQQGIYERKGVPIFHGMSEKIRKQKALLGGLKSRRNK